MGREMRMSDTYFMVIHVIQIIRLQINLWVCYMFIFLVFTTYSHTYTHKNIRILFARLCSLNWIGIAEREQLEKQQQRKHQQCALATKNSTWMNGRWLFALLEKVSRASDCIHSKWDTEILHPWNVCAWNFIHIYKIIDILCVWVRIELQKLLSYLWFFVCYQLARFSFRWYDTIRESMFFNFANSDNARGGEGDRVQSHHFCQFHKHKIGWTWWPRMMRYIKWEAK